MYAAGATGLNWRATEEEVRKIHHQLQEETCRHSWYFKSCWKNPSVHSPYLREAKVKDIRIQLLHCPHEPVSAEILSTELAVETSNTCVYTYLKKAKCCENTPTGDIRIMCPGFLTSPRVKILTASTCLNCTASFRVLRRLIFHLARPLAFHRRALLAPVSPVSAGQVM